MSEAESTVRPQLRIERVQIEHLKAIRSLRLPENGLGWEGRIPDLVMVGGANGSGKTTLLEALFQAFSSVAVPVQPWPPESSIEVDLSLESSDFEEVLRPLRGPVLRPEETSLRLRYKVAHGTAQAMVRDEARSLPDPRDLAWRTKQDHAWGLGSLAIRQFLVHPRSRGPRLVLLPSQRQLSTLETGTKTASPLRMEAPFAYRWSPPAQWQGSLESILYDARWMDLNAKEEGEPSPRYFDAFAEEFHAFTGGKKRLVWRKGELVVETDDKHTHGLGDLSSGEKQILLLLTDLNRLWAPGSLVMIDEPELHLHDQWQSHLLRRLKAFLSERGGQLWMATQSDTLFRLADPGSALVLR